MKTFELSPGVLAGFLLCAPQAWGQTPPPVPAPAPAAQAPAAAPAPAPETTAAPEAPQAPAPAAPPPPPVFVAPPPAAAPAAPPPVDYSAQPEADEPEVPDDGSLGRHQQHLVLGIGVRTTFIADAGFDPFSEEDALPQVTLDAGAVLWTSDALSIAALVGWDYGSSSSSARGAQTSLDVHRLWLAAEARYHLLRRLYAFGRLAPALLESKATLNDATVNAQREASSWVMGADLSLGAAYEVVGHKNGAVRSARGWLGLEGGYGWAASSDLMLEVEEDAAAPSRTAALDLGELALRGAFVRANLNLTF